MGDSNAPLVVRLNCDPQIFLHKGKPIIPLRLIEFLGEENREFYLSIRDAFMIAYFNDSFTERALAISRLYQVLPRTTFYMDLTASDELCYSSLIFTQEYMPHWMEVCLVDLSKS